MATIASPSIRTQEISTLDVLWALYQSQSKKIRKAFLKRLADEEESTTVETELMKAYERSLTSEQRKAAYEFADTVKQRVADVEKASADGRKVGRSAFDFLQELESEE